MVTGTTDTTADNLVEKSIALLEERAGKLGPTNRCYAYRADDLQDIEWQVPEVGPGEQLLHDRIVALYTGWPDAMTAEGRHQLFESNHAHRGTRRWNHVPEEVLEPR
jgi:hypothetical protein